MSNRGFDFFLEINEMLKCSDPEVWRLTSRRLNALVPFKKDMNPNSETIASLSTLREAMLAYRQACEALSIAAEEAEEELYNSAPVEVRPVMRYTIKKTMEN